MCLGDLLACTEIRIMFEEPTPRLSGFVNGIERLPAEVTPA